MVQAAALESLGRHPVVGEQDAVNISRPAEISLPDGLLGRLAVFIGELAHHARLSVADAPGFTPAGSPQQIGEPIDRIAPRQTIVAPRDRPVGRVRNRDGPPQRLFRVALAEFTNQLADERGMIGRLRADLLAQANRTSGPRESRTVARPQSGPTPWASRQRVEPPAPAAVPSPASPSPPRDRSRRRSGRHLPSVACLFRSVDRRSIADVGLRAQMPGRTPRATVPATRSKPG